MKIFRDLLIAGQFNRKVSLATLLALPPAAFSQGHQFFVPDFGIGGSWWYSDGSRWRAKGGSVIFGTLPALATHSGVAGSEEKLYFAKLPANIYKVGDMLDIYISVDAQVTDLGTDVVNARIGTANAVTDTVLTSMSQPSAANKFGTMNKRFRREIDPTLRATEINGGGGFGGSGTNALASVAAPAINTDAWIGVYVKLVAGNTRILTLRNAVFTLFTCGA